MPRSLVRYLTLLALFFKFSLMKQMAYRPNFVMLVVGKAIRIGLLILFFQAVFMKVDHIGSWSYDGVLLLLATFHVVDYLMSVTFQRNLAFSLPRRIQMGEFDRRIILPVNSLFLSSLEEIDLADLLSFLPSLGFLGYVFYRLDFSFSFGAALTYALLVINALVFLFAITLIIATISFWTTRAVGLARIFDNLMKIGRYPLDIFEGFWRLAFMYLLPLVLIAQVPSQVILGGISPRFLIFAVTISAVFLLAALAFWRVGVKNYQSTSS